MEPFPGHIVDVVVTHTTAENENSDSRQKQVIVLGSTKQVFVLDFTSSPLLEFYGGELDYLTGRHYSTIIEC